MISPKNTKKLSITTLIIIFILLSVYVYIRINTIAYLRSEQYFYDTQDIEDYYWNHFYVFNELPSLNPSTYKSASKNLPYKAWPKALERLLELDPYYNQNKRLCIDLKPNILFSCDYDTLKNLGFLDMLFTQKTLVLNNMQFDTLLFPDRSGDIFLTKNGFELTDDIKLRNSINRELRLYSDYYVFNSNLKEDIKNHIKYIPSDTSDMNFEVLFGDVDFFRNNKQVLEDFEKVLSRYKKKLERYDAIYFDLYLYPSVMDSISEEAKTRRKKAAYNRASSILN